MYYVYILKSVKSKFVYKGLTDHLDRRIRQHNSGKVRSTRHYLPFDLVYCEEWKTRDEAREREKFFKSGYGREIIDQIVEES